jgi:hypothetical protein
MSIILGSGLEVTTPTTPSSAVSASSGSLDNGANYSYKVTYVNPWGESAPSAGSTNTLTTATQALDVTIPVSSDVTVSARKIYRTQGGASVYQFHSTINNNTTTSFTDIVADASLTASPSAPSDTSSAMSAQIVKGNVRFSMPFQVGGVAAITAGANAGGQASATAIGLNQYASVTTGAATDGVLLPLLNANIIGMAIYVNNLSAANSLRVFPSSTQTINGGGGGAAATHAVSIGRWYVATTATNWVQV